MMAPIFLSSYRFNGEAQNILTKQNKFRAISSVYSKVSCEHELKVMFCIISGFFLNNVKMKMKFWCWENVIRNDGRNNKGGLDECDGVLASQVLNIMFLRQFVHSLLY